MEVLDLASRLLGFFLWLGWGLGIAVMISGGIAYALARPGLARILMVSGLASILIYAYFPGLYDAIASGLLSSTNDLLSASSTAIYLLGFSAIVAGGIYIALGSWGRGVQLLGGSLLMAILAMGIPALFQISSTGFSQGLDIRLSVDPQVIQPGGSVRLSIWVSGGSAPYSVEIDWGDGSVDRVSSNGYSEALHSYSGADKGYRIYVRAWDGRGAYGSSVASVAVAAAPAIPWPFSFIADMFLGVSRVFAGFIGAPIGLLITSPLIPMDDSDPLFRAWSLIATASLAGFGLFLAFNTAYRAFRAEDIGGSLAESLKEGVFAAVLILIAIPLYNATASLLNSIAWMIIEPHMASIGSGFALVAGLFALSLVTGYFIPALASLGAFLALSSIFLIAIALVRYYLIAALVVGSPLLIIAWLHPGLRGAAQALLGVLAALMLMGPIASIALSALFSGAGSAGGEAGAVAAYLASPIILALLPQILGSLGLSIPGAGFVSRIASLIPSARSGQATATSASSTAQQGTPSGARIALVRTAPVISREVFERGRRRSPERIEIPAASGKPLGYRVEGVKVDSEVLGKADEEILGVRGVERIPRERREILVKAEEIRDIEERRGKALEALEKAGRGDPVAEIALSREAEYLGERLRALEKGRAVLVKTRAREAIDIAREAAKQLANNTKTMATKIAEEIKRKAKQ
jgi:carbon starvation protein